MGAVCFCVMCALGEMSASLPHKRGFTGYATDFVDPAFGLATGYNYLCKYLIVTPNQLSASAILVSYWAPTLNPAVTISAFLVAIIAINFLGIRYFGEQHAPYAADAAADTTPQARSSSGCPSPRSSCSRA